MDIQTLSVTNEDNIVIITINRPDALNAINSQVMGELNYVFSNSIDKQSTKGVIITGSGQKAFVAGADITELQNKNEQEGYSLAKKGHDTFGLIENFPLPVIAAINGFSLGGGNELAMACHIRIAAPNAKFGQPEVNLGLIPGFGGTQRLIQYLGKGRAMELLLTGDMIDANQALEYGLITHIIPQEELLDKAKSMINKIGQKGPLAIASTIQAVNAFFDKSANGFVRELVGFSKTIESEESTEGVAAFLEKRKPNFRKS